MENIIKIEDYAKYQFDQYPIREIINEINPKFDSEGWGGAATLGYEENEFDYMYAGNFSKLTIQVFVVCNSFCLCPGDPILDCECDEIDDPHFEITYTKKQIKHIRSQLELFT